MNIIRYVLSVGLCLNLFFFALSVRADNTLFNSVKDEGLLQVIELMQELTQWESEGDWENFFEKKEEYQTKINTILDSIPENSPKAFRAKYLAWKVSLVFSGASRQAFDTFIISTRNIENPSKEDLAFIESVIADLGGMERERLKSRVSSIYKELLKSTAAPIELKRQATKLYSEGDVDSSAALFRSYFNSFEETEITFAELTNIIYMFVDDGLNEKVDALFAEELFVKLFELQDGNASEDIFYLRAYNLERMGNYAAASSFYTKLLEKYPESLYSDEIKSRIDYIDQYKEKSIQKTDSNSKYKNYNEELFFSILQGKEELLGRNFATLAVRPSKSLLNQEIAVDARAMSSDTGCLVPAGLYLWSGDIGNYVIESNTSNFKTEHLTPGIKIISLAEKAAQGILGYDSYMYEVYDVSIYTENTVVSKGDDLVCNLNILPYISDKLISVEWEIEDHEELSLSGNSIEVRCDREGSFDIIARVSYLGRFFASVKKHIEVK